jgi:hypothetical protein
MWSKDGIFFAPFKSGGASNMTQANYTSKQSSTSFHEM